MELIACLAHVGISCIDFRWNYLHDSLRGESKQKLNELDTSLNLSEKCLTLLKSRNLEKKLLAIETLGNLGKKSAWNALKEYVDAGDSIVSLKTDNYKIGLRNSGEFYSLPKKNFITKRIIQKKRYE